MTNRIIKRVFTHKSKLLLTLLCILGLVFSYSCSCRNNSTAPGDGGGNGDTGNGLTGGIQNGQGGMDYTPATTLSRTLMVVKSDASDTSYPITITVQNADIDTWDISGDTLTKADFDFVDGTLKVNKGLKSVKDTKEDYTLTLNYKKTSSFNENDKLTKTSDTKTFQLIKAKRYSDTDLENELKKLTVVNFGDKGNIGFYNTKISGNKVEIEIPNEPTHEVNTSDILIALKSRLSEVTTNIKGIEEVKEPNISTDKKIATFYLKLVFDDTIETTKFNDEIPLTLPLTLKSADDKVIWNKQ